MDTEADQSRENLDEKIKGMKIIPINKYEDTRGSLSVLASYGREDAPEMSKIEEVYFAEIQKRGTVRAGHKHDKTDEFFIIFDYKELKFFFNGLRNDIGAKSNLDFSFPSCS